MTVSVGATATTAFTVTESDTAMAMGSGDVPVLGTPRMIAWCERATVLALEPELDPGQTTVGFRIRVDHLAPTALDRRVEVTATVDEIDGRQITLSVSVDEGGVTVAEGSITRVVVDREKFLSRIG